MREIELLVDGLKGRFGKLRKGQVISDENLSLAGHDVDTLLSDGKARDTAQQPSLELQQPAGDEPIPVRDLHHMKAKAAGLVKSEDGEFWVKPTS